MTMQCLYAVYIEESIFKSEQDMPLQYMDVVKENRYSFGPLIVTLSFFVCASVIQCQVSASIDIGRRSRSPVTEPGPVSPLTVCGSAQGSPGDRQILSQLSAEGRRAQTQRYCVKTCVSN